MYIYQKNICPSILHKVDIFQTRALDFQYIMENFICRNLDDRTDRVQQTDPYLDAGNMIIVICSTCKLIFNV